jgi:hypothetical protein
VFPLHLRKTAAHVSLSSIFNCQKQTEQNPSKIPINPTQKSGNKSAIQPISRSCLNQSGRPCGAALSFGEAAYTANLPNRQQPVFTKVQKMHNYLLLLCIFLKPWLAVANDTKNRP